VRVSDSRRTPAVEDSKMARRPAGEPDRIESSGELQAEQPDSTGMALGWADIPAKGKATLRIELAWDLENLPNELTLVVDSMDELAESASLKLQMVMDRRSKSLSTLSNILKKLADTQGSILANLK
jgi:hypothetical protein